MASEPFTLTLTNGSNVTIEIVPPDDGDSVVERPDRGSVPVKRIKHISHHRRNRGGGDLRCYFCHDRFPKHDARIRHCKKDHPEEYKRRQEERHKKKAPR